MVEIVGSIVTVLGILLAVLTFWTNFPDHRAKRYSERSKAILELRGVTAELGVYSGPGATTSSIQAHGSLLADLEARANIVMYLKSAGRLNRPGSATPAFGLRAYGFLLFWWSSPATFRNPKLRQRRK